MNTTVVQLRNLIVDIREQIKGLCENEETFLEMYTEDKAELENGRNKKGEYVNFAIFESNIRAMQETIDKLNDALNTFSMSASVYL